MFKVKVQQEGSYFEMVSEIETISKVTKYLEGLCEYNHGLIMTIVEVRDDKQGV